MYILRSLLSTKYDKSDPKKCDLVWYFQNEAVYKHQLLGLVSAVSTYHKLLMHKVKSAVLAFHLRCCSTEAMCQGRVRDAKPLATLNYNIICTFSSDNVNNSYFVLETNICVSKMDLSNSLNNEAWKMAAILHTTSSNTFYQVERYPTLVSIEQECR